MKDKSLVWHKRIERQRKSNLSVQSYCDQNRLSVCSFYYWNRKLKSHLLLEQFTEIRIADHAKSNPGILVRFPTGVEMWLEEGTDPAFLRSLAGIVVSH